MRSVINRPASATHRHHGRGRPIGATSEESAAGAIEVEELVRAGVRRLDGALWRSKKRNITGKLSARTLADRVGVSVSAIHKWRKRPRYLAALRAGLVAAWEQSDAAFYKNASSVLSARLAAHDEEENRRKPQRGRPYLKAFTVQEVRRARLRDAAAGKAAPAISTLDQQQHATPDAFYVHVIRANEEGYDHQRLTTRGKVRGRATSKKRVASEERLQLCRVEGSVDVFEDSKGERYRALTNGKEPVFVRERTRDRRPSIGAKLALDTRSDADFQADMSREMKRAKALRRSTRRFEWG